MKLIFCFLLLATAITAQNGPATLLKMLYAPDTLNSDFAGMVQRTYVSYSFGETAKPDTTIDYNGKKVDLYLQSAEARTLAGPGTVVGRSLMPGEEKFSETVIYGSHGRAVSRKVDSGDSEVAEMINQDITYAYTNSGNLALIRQQVSDQMRVVYNDKNGIDSMIISAGFGNMLITTTQEKDFIRYNLSFMQGQPMSGLMGEMGENAANSPKEFTEQYIGETTYTFKNYKEDRTTKQPKLESEQVTDKNYNVLGSKEMSHDGVESEATYKYNSKGQLQLSEEGALTTNYTYDEKGSLSRVVITSKENEQEEALVSLTLIENQYK